MAHSKVRVLHLLESAGGGVPAAVASYIENSPEGIAHLVLCKDAQYFRSRFGSRVQVFELNDGHVRRFFQVLQMAKRMRPEFLHSHSSFAGLYARIVSLRRFTTVVFTPHCYGFERRDISFIKRALLWGAEFYLGFNTDRFACCSLREIELIPKLSRRPKDIFYVPNVSALSAAEREKIIGDRLDVFMSGRIAKQKDPGYFASIVDKLRHGGHLGSATWVGDGETHLKRQLEQGGISVTGWIAPAEMAESLSAFNLYLHTAAWEGYPIAVLDAFKSGIPVLVRSIPAFGQLPQDLTIEFGLQELLEVMNSQEGLQAWAFRNRELWGHALATNDQGSQTEALANIWSIDIMGRSKTSKSETRKLHVQ